MPNQVTLLQGEKYSIRTCFGTEILTTSEVSTGSEANFNVEISLFGKIKLKEISVKYVKDNYNIETVDDISDAICIGEAYIKIFS